MIDGDTKNTRISISSRWWMVAILCSLMWALGVAWLAAGHDATPYGTTDSSGNPFGFNDPLTPGLAVMLLKNATFKGIFAVMDPYYLLCLAMHGVGLGILALRRFVPWFVTAFFALQMILFPLGWLAQAVAASMFLGGDRIDGETFQDLPFTNMFAAAAWVPLSLLVVLQRLTQSIGARHTTSFAVAERLDFQQN